MEVDKGARRLALLCAMTGHPETRTKTIPPEMVHLMKQLHGQGLVAQVGPTPITECGWYITELGLEVARRLEAAIPAYSRLAASKLRVVDGERD